MVAMKFNCYAKGTQLKDSCGGFRVDNSCFRGQFAFKAMTTKGQKWERNGNYECPRGWKWATYKEYNNARRYSCNHYSYYSKCGWSGYTYGGVSSRYYFRFKDSNTNCRYQHAGSYVPKGNTGSSCSTNYFGGIVCKKNRL